MYFSEDTSEKLVELQQFSVTDRSNTDYLNDKHDRNSSWKLDENRNETEIAMKEEEEFTGNGNDGNW